MCALPGCSECSDIFMWRHIDMRNSIRWRMLYDVEQICQHAVKYIANASELIRMEYFGFNAFCKYLKGLVIFEAPMFCDAISGQCLIETIKNSSFPEEIHLCYVYVLCRSF